MWRVNTYITSENDFLLGVYVLMWAPPYIEFWVKKYRIKLDMGARITTAPPSKSEKGLEHKM